MCDPDDEVEKMQYKVFMELLQYIKSAADSPDIELQNILYTEAKNLVWARLKINKYYKGETYVLQIDSGVRFLKDWDINLVSAPYEAAFKIMPATDYDSNSCGTDEANRLNKIECYGGAAPVFEGYNMKVEAKSLM